MSGPKHGCSSDSQVRAVHHILTTASILAFFAGIVLLGLAVDTVSGYNATHPLSDHLLPVWHEDSDIRPTYALVAGSGIITAANALSLFTSNTPSVRGLLSNFRCKSKADPRFIPPSA